MATEISRTVLYAAKEKPVDKRQQHTNVNNEMYHYASYLALKFITHTKTQYDTYNFNIITLTFLNT